jgi:hypothetical protein
VLLLAACTQDDASIPLARWDSAVSAPDSPIGKVDAATVDKADAAIVSTLDASLSSLLDAFAAVPREAGAGAAVDDDTLLTLAAQLISICPSVAPNDAPARERCADGLTKFDAFRDVIAEPLLWGAQPAGLALAEVPEQATLTNLNPRVWRRLYLSTLMFESPARVEDAGKYRALRVPVRFRNGLDAGDYPYPFWHAEKKWASYEQATSIVFLFEGKRLVAAVRSAQHRLGRLGAQVRQETLLLLFSHRPGVVRTPDELHGLGRLLDPRRQGAHREDGDQLLVGVSRRLRGRVFDLEEGRVCRVTSHARPIGIAGVGLGDPEHRHHAAIGRDDGRLAPEVARLADLPLCFGKAVDDQLRGASVPFERGTDDDGSRSLHGDQRALGSVDDRCDGRIGRAERRALLAERRVPERHRQRCLVSLHVRGVHGLEQELEHAIVDEARGPASCVLASTLFTGGAPSSPSQTDP